MFRVKFILNEYKYVGSKFHEFETLELSGSMSGNLKMNQGRCVIALIQLWYSSQYKCVMVDNKS